MIPYDPLYNAEADAVARRDRQRFEKAAELRQELAHERQDQPRYEDGIEAQAAVLRRFQERAERQRAADRAAYSTPGSDR